MWILGIYSWQRLHSKKVLYSFFIQALLCLRSFLHCNDIVTGSSLKCSKGQYLDRIPGLCMKPVCIKATIRTKM